MARKESRRYNSVLMPEYLSRFSCTGQACDDCCCFGWNIFIDEKTYKKYRRVMDPEFKPLIEKAVSKVRSNSSVHNYGKIKLDENGFCPLLSDNKLCRLQQKFGEEYLSAVCSTYPRYTNLVDEVLEGSGTLSCPEIAKLVLLDPEPIVFEQTERWPHRDYLLRSTFRTPLASGGSWQKFFWDLRIFTIKLLQDRHLSIEERLILLTLFYGKVQKLKDSNQIEEINSLLQEFNGMLNDNQMISQVLTSLPTADNLQLRIVKLVIDMRYLLKSSLSRRYMECYQEFIRGIQCMQDAQWEQVVRSYQSAYQDYYKPWLDGHSYVLENYLVNYVFMNLIPCQPGMSLLESYGLLVIHYAYLRTFLVGLAAYHQGLNDELVIKLFQSFSRMWSITILLKHKILDLFHKEGFFETSYLAALIRN